jgi:hypothetical protein
MKNALVTMFGFRRGLENRLESKSASTKVTSKDMRYDLFGDITATAGMPQISTLTDAAARLGVSVAMLYNLKNKNSMFPRPLNPDAARGAMYNVEDLKKFIKYYNAVKRSPGRPKKAAA